MHSLPACLSTTVTPRALATSPRCCLDAPAMLLHGPGRQPYQPHGGQACLPPLPWLGVDRGACVAGLRCRGLAAALPRATAFCAVVHGPHVAARPGLGAPVCAHATQVRACILDKHELPYPISLPLACKLIVTIKHQKSIAHSWLTRESCIDRIQILINRGLFH